MKIHLPNTAFIGNIDAFLNGFDVSHPESLEITTHDAWISLHPVVLAMVAALGLKVGADNVTIDQVTARSGHYLERMGLSRMLGLSSQFSTRQRDSSGRFIPLTQVRSTEEMSSLIKEMIPLLHLEPHQAEPIRYIVSELVRNVLEHAISPDGAIVAAQYHTKSNMIRIGIADAGIGFRESIGASHFAPDDLIAIKLALVPGVTGTTSREGGTDYNAGAGLFFTKSIASANRNFFMIYSGNALYKLLKRPASSRLRLHAIPDNDKHSERADLPYWQGAVLGIDLSLDSTSEFSALLDVIRATYTEALRERRKAKLKKARFV
jgi:anti-sigma regulatory factor (Ser/Thr protein kinase)